MWLRSGYNRIGDEAGRRRPDSRRAGARRHAGAAGPASCPRGRGWWRWPPAAARALGLRRTARARDAATARRAGRARRRGPARRGSRARTGTPRARIATYTSVAGRGIGSNRSRKTTKITGPDNLTAPASPPASPVARFRCPSQSNCCAITSPRSSWSTGLSRRGRRRTPARTRKREPRA